MNVLAIVWFGAAATGVLAGLTALLVQRVRQPALMVAGASFAVAGVLGIFSIGVVFIALAVLCFNRASRSSAPLQPPPPVASEN